MNYWRIPAAVLISTAVLLVCTVVSGADDPLLRDVVYLKSGATLKGQVRLIQVDNRDYYIVELDDGAVLKLDRWLVRRVQQPSAELIEYARRRAGMHDTVDGHMEMQLWCRDNKLNDQREYHLMRIIQLDPDHREARALAGYMMRDGQWVHEEQFFARHGYVRDKLGAWKLPEGIAYDEQQEQIRKAQADWKSTLKNLRKDYVRGKDRAEAEQQVRSINDPLAVEPLWEMYEEEKQSPEFRQLVVQTLAHIDSPAVRQKLVNIALGEADQRLMNIAIENLLQDRFDRVLVARSLFPLMNPTPNTQNEHVNRAGYILGELNESSAIRPLIDGLKTLHDVANPAARAGNVGAAFGNGGGGLQMGNQPPTLTLEVNNESVLSALRKLTPVDFGFDHNAWLNWYLETMTITRVDLRRDE